MSNFTIPYELANSNVPKYFSYHEDGMGLLVGGIDTQPPDHTHTVTPPDPVTIRSIKKLVQVQRLDPFVASSAPLKGRKTRVTKSPPQRRPRRRQPVQKDAEASSSSSSTPSSSSSSSSQSYPRLLPDPAEGRRKPFIYAPYHQTEPTNANRPPQAAFPEGTCETDQRAALFPHSYYETVARMNSNFLSTAALSDEGLQGMDDESFNEIRKYLLEH